MRRGRLLWLGLPLAVAGIGFAIWAAFLRTPPPLAASKFELVWEYESPHPGAVVAGPCIGDDRVYVGLIRDTGFTPRGAVIALNRVTGKPAWTFDDGGEMLHMYSSPRLSDGRLYIGEGMHANFACKLYALDSATGRKLWHAPAAGHIESTPTIANGVVVFGAGDDGVHELDAATGAPRWHFPGPGHVDSTAAVEGNRVYVGAGESRRYKESALLCLSAADGGIVWRTPVELPAWGSPVLAEGRVYYGLGNGRIDRPTGPPAGSLVCADARSGRIVWTHKATDAVMTRPVVDTANVYFVSRDGIVSAVPLGGGPPVWTRSLNDTVAAGLTMLAGRLYVVTLSGKLFALNAANGEMVATFDVSELVGAPARILSRPAVVVEADLRHLVVFGTELQTAVGNKAVVFAMRLADK